MPDVIRTRDERFSNLPGWKWEPHYTEVHGLRLARLDEGDGKPVVCIHGEPTWGYLYRHIVDQIVEAGHRIVAPDLPGFGRSDKPTDDGWYTFDRHCEHLTHHLAPLDLRDITLVVHDWGGPIGLRWAIENRDRVSSLVILNTGVFTGVMSRGFLSWQRFAATYPDLPAGLVVQGATSRHLEDEVVAAYDAPFPSFEAKSGSRAFPRQVPTTGEHRNVKPMLELEHELRSWAVPATVAFGDADPVFPWPQAPDYLAKLLPGASDPLRLAGAHHFVQEDYGEALAEIVLSSK